MATLTTTTGGRSCDHQARRQEQHCKKFGFHFLVSSFDLSKVLIAFWSPS
jgi:hypothetical protein